MGSLGIFRQGIRRVANPLSSTGDYLSKERSVADYIHSLHIRSHCQAVTEHSLRCGLNHTSTSIVVNLNLQEKLFESIISCCSTV